MARRRRVRAPLPGTPPAAGAATGWRAVVQAHRDAPPAASSPTGAGHLTYRLAARQLPGGRATLFAVPSLAGGKHFKPIPWRGIAARKSITPMARLTGRALSRYLDYGRSPDLPGWESIADAHVAAALALLAQVPNLEDERGQPLRLRPDTPVTVTLRYERDGAAGLLRAIVQPPAGEPPGDPSAVMGHPQAWVWVGDALYPLDGPSDALRGGQAATGIPPDERAEFERRHLPDLVVAGRITSPVVPAVPKVIDVAPTPQLVLEEAEGRLMGRLGFVYGGMRVEADEPSQHVGPPEGPWFVRRPRAEARAVQQLPAAPPARPWYRPIKTAAFAMAGDAALDFLFDGLPGLMDAGFEILGENRLAISPTRSVPVTRFEVGSGIDWLALRGEVRVDDEVVPWPEVWAAIAQHRRYIRLGSGRLARLPAGWLAELRPLLESMGFRPEAAGDGTLRVPRHHAGLVAQVLAAVDEAVPDPGTRALLAKLATFGGVADVAPPVGFVGDLRPYQRKGLSYLAFLRDYGLGGILADDMGLGKTVQAAALLAANHAMAGGAPSLVVAPTSVIHNWRMELAKFAPGLRTLVLHGPQREVAAIADHDVIITTYATVRQDLKAHQQRRYHTIILDEAQAIKNPGSQTASALRTLEADHRLCLTGTPIENNLMELWSQFAFLMPGLLGGETDFRRRYATPIAAGDARAIAELKARIGPFILRRLKAEVAKDLPPRTDAVVWCELAPAQRRLYDTVLAASRAKVMAAVAEAGVGQSHLLILEALLRLRQVCCDPALLGVPETMNLPSAKVEAFMALVDELVEGGHRALVFSQFTSMLGILRERLDTAGVAYEYLDGSTKDRQTRVTRFNKGGAPLFLISLKAGGTGLNLTGADYVIHFDPWWNPAVEDQATDRAHRIGQTRHVFAYKLVAKDTIEEKLLALQDRKRALVRDVLDVDALGKHLTRDDLESLFGDGK